MISTTLPSFWDRYHALPAQDQAAARSAFEQFIRDPHHPSLHFKPLRGVTGIWSVRVTRSVRAVCRRIDDRVIWFWIGTHADFDREF